MRFLRHLFRLFGEFWGFAWREKAWWIIPVVIVLLVLGVENVTAAFSVHLRQCFHDRRFRLVEAVEVPKQVVRAALGVVDRVREYEVAFHADALAWVSCSRMLKATLVV